MKTSKRPTVTILCTTYNHRDYIKQALDSFLMQERSFDIEVLINDDASTDGTTEIIQDYQKKYPEIIYPVFHKENQYQNGVRHMMTRFLLPKAKGKYLAICEGDDYWTDKFKLQKQVDYLQQHKDYSLCFHPVKVVYENNERKNYTFPKLSDKNNFTIERLLKENFIQTNSVMYRTQNYADIKLNMMPGDWYLHVFHAQFGKIGFINEVMSVYRRHSDSLWWNSRGDKSEIWKKHGVSHMMLFLEFHKIFGSVKRYRSIILKSMSDMLGNIIETDPKLIHGVIDSFGLDTHLLIEAEHTEALCKQKKIDELSSTIVELREAVERRDATIAKQKSKLDFVYGTKEWKIHEAISRLKISNRNTSK